MSAYNVNYFHGQANINDSSSMIDAAVENVIKKGAARAAPFFANKTNIGIPDFINYKT